ncbi:MAG: hypothetical protein ACR2N7_05190 [Acidimicrobiia bacterium]
MSKLAVAMVVVALVIAACTGSGDSEVTTSSTTTPAPVTTLPPASTTTSTVAVSETTTTTIAVPTNDCVVAADVSVEGYEKACTVLDIVLRSDEEVDDNAFAAQSDRIYNMLITRPDLTEAVASGAEGRIIGADQRITTLPEFTELYELFPGIDWDRRERAYPGSSEVPYFAGAEENLLCSDDDRNEGEDMFVRVFGLTIRRFGLDVVDPSTSTAIDQAYGRAIAAGLWENTLAEINSDEYWMEGVQSYFDANLENNDEDRAPNSSHNHVNTRDELRTYDPALFSVAESVFTDGTWRPTCPT